MNKWLDPADPLEEVEAMVAAAGRYVRASDDLRPRVLEAARIRSAERRARRSIRLAAAAVIVLAISTSWAGHWLNTRAAAPPTALLAMDSRRLYVQAEAHAVHTGGIGWGIVEAFNDLRRRQSEAIGLTF